MSCMHEQKRHYLHTQRKMWGFFAWYNFFTYFKVLSLFSKIFRHYIVCINVRGLSNIQEFNYCYQVKDYVQISNQVNKVELYQNLFRYDLERNIWIAKNKFDQNFLAHTKANSILGSNLWMIYNESKDIQIQYHNFIYINYLFSFSFAMLQTTLLF